MMSMKACVQLQHDNMNNARDMTQTSAEIMMVQETDVLMVVSQARADEKKRNVTHMFHDMLPTQSMINTMGGGNVVTETNNSKYTSCMTEIMCGAGHCKQLQTQPSIGECCIECAEDKLTQKNELYNATHKIQHHTYPALYTLLGVDKVCCVGKPKPFDSQPSCCRVARDINEGMCAKTEHANEHKHKIQHTTQHTFPEKERRTILDEMCCVGKPNPSHWQPDRERVARGINEDRRVQTNNRN